MNSMEEQNAKYFQDLMDRDLQCDTTCRDLGNRPYAVEDNSLSAVDWLIEHLPGYNYVVERMLNYMFADGLATGEEKGDERLNAWLYDSKNRSGATNYAELRECLRRSIGYGECGLRKYEGNIYHVPIGYYGRLIDRTDGIDETVLYFIRKDRQRVDGRIRTDEWDEWKDYGDVTSWFDEKGYILLDPSEFQPIERNPATAESVSPLLSDRDRVNLLVAVYDQLNYDIRYDGPGRTLFRLKSGFAEGDENDISTGEVLGNTPEQRTERLDKAKKEVGKLMKEIKNSSSDSIGVLSTAFDDKYIHLPRVTKATEFLNWLSNDTTIMAQILGMSPTLLEVGKLHGNISVQHIIDNAMLNTVVPMREVFATQFSEFIGPLVGVSKVFFNKYNMAQIEDENESRGKMAVVIRDLSTAAKNIDDENLRNLINETAEVLRSSLYDDNKELKKM